MAYMHTPPSVPSRTIVYACMNMNEGGVRTSAILARQTKGCAFTLWREGINIVIIIIRKDHHSNNNTKRRGSASREDAQQNDTTS